MAPLPFHSDAFLLSRLALELGNDHPDLWGELSAIAIDGDGFLWLGSDEYTTLECLAPINRSTYGDHKDFALHEIFKLPEQDQEIDIEGLCYDGGYLWTVGSHSQKRKRPKGKQATKDLDRLAEVVIEPNRYFLGRVPVANGAIAQEIDDRRAACLPMDTDGNNPIMEALAEDRHLGTYLNHPIPSKENGLDIEGLAVRGNRVWLGLRGPVLRGWAIILELAIEVEDDGMLSLNTLPKSDRVYRKHILELGGLGIRDLCWYGDDLLVLAGPTMAADGPLSVYRWHLPDEDEDDTLQPADGDRLKRWMRLPVLEGCDYAEGLTVTNHLGSEALLVVCDGPDVRRRINANTLLVDCFALPDDNG